MFPLVLSQTLGFQGGKRLRASLHEAVFVQTAPVRQQNHLRHRTSVLRIRSGVGSGKNLSSLLFVTLSLPFIGSG